jgi:predicted ArsR family transcriptional regulator
MSMTQDAILDLLRRRKAATVAELAQALGLTRADIRYHLQALLGAGRVERLPLAGTKLGRGRPEHRYRLPDLPLTQALVDLARALLCEQHTSMASAEEHRVFLTRLAGQFHPEPREPMPHSLRIPHLVQQLNQQGYEAAWEAHADGPHILLRRCPFGRLAVEFPVLCEMDRVGLSRACRTELALTARISQAHPRCPACVFRPAVRVQ